MTVFPHQSSLSREERERIRRETPQLFALAPVLTERQKAALDLLPAKDIEVGWELHRRRGCHQCQHASHPCEFAASSGREVLSAIRRKTRGLVVRRHSGVWERLDGSGSQDTGWGGF